MKPGTTLRFVSLSNVSSILVWLTEPQPPKAYQLLHPSGGLLLFVTSCCVPLATSFNAQHVTTYSNFCCALHGLILMPQGGERHTGTNGQHPRSRIDTSARHFDDAAARGTSTASTASAQAPDPSRTAARVISAPAGAAKAPSEATCYKYL